MFLNSFQCCQILQNSIFQFIEFLILQTLYQYYQTHFTYIFSSKSRVYVEQVRYMREREQREMREKFLYERRESKKTWIMLRNKVMIFYPLTLFEEKKNSRRHDITG